MASSVFSGQLKTAAQVHPPFKKVTEVAPLLSSRHPLASFCHSPDFSVCPVLFFCWSERLFSRFFFFFLVPILRMTPQITHRHQKLLFCQTRSLAQTMYWCRTHAFLFWNAQQTRKEKPSGVSKTPAMTPSPDALLLPLRTGAGDRSCQIQAKRSYECIFYTQRIIFVRWTGGIICGHNYIWLTCKKLPEGVMQCPVNILEMDFQAGAVGLVPGFPPIWWSHLEKRLTGLVSLLHSQWSKCPFIFIHCF